MKPDKTTITDLAIFGGDPAFSEPLHVGRPNIGDRGRLMARLNEMLDRRWLTNNGPFVREFERRIADYVGVRHCVATCNATVALEIAARALDLSGEVIVPSFTFIATAHAFQWLGITPVFCDIAPGTHYIDPAAVERLITPRTTGIVGVHVWGQPCDVDALEAIARRHRLHLLFDAAHALACSYRGRLIGAFGDAEVFSFHATKAINAFEGGAVTTNDADLADRLRLMRNFGFAGFDDVQDIGTNGKMTEASAAMGLTSLESLDAVIAVNRAHYDSYRHALDDLPGVQMLHYDEAERSNYQYIILEIDEATAGISRDALVQVLRTEGVLARRYFYPGCHQMAPYRTNSPYAGAPLPETENLARSVVSLPTGTSLSDDDVQRVCQIIRLAITHHRAVAEALSATPKGTR